MKDVSRRQFLATVLRRTALLKAWALAVACAPGRPGAVPAAPPPILAREHMVLKEVTEMRRVARLVGEGSLNDTPANYGVYGADLGSMFDMDGKVHMVFGDSFGCCIPGTGGPGNARDWRSNTMAIISDRDPGDGLMFDTMITDRPRHAKELLPPGPGDRTVIPTHGVAVGKRMFLHYMAVRSWGQPGEWLLNESGLAYSDNGGHSWKYASTPRWSANSNFGQVAIVRLDNDLYFFGIPGGRFGGVKLARVSQDAILDRRAYRYYSGLADDRPQWHEDESAAALLVPAPVGELSVIWNAYLTRWIMTSLDQHRRAITVREAPELWGPWSVALPVVHSWAYPGLYGAYMHPWYTEHEGEIVYFAMSQWGPYSVFWMRARLLKR